MAWIYLNLKKNWKIFSIIDRSRPRKSINVWFFLNRIAMHYISMQVGCHQRRFVLNVVLYVFELTKKRRRPRWSAWQIPFPVVQRKILNCEFRFWPTTFCKFTFLLAYHFLYYFLYDTKPVSAQLLLFNVELHTQCTWSWHVFLLLGIKKHL